MLAADGADAGRRRLRARQPRARDEDRTNRASGPAFEVANALGLSDLGPRHIAAPGPIGGPGPSPYEDKGSVRL